LSRFEFVLDPQTRLGECPVWSVERQALFFVDITGRQLHCFDPASREHRTLAVSEDIGCFGFARGGGFIAGMRSGVWLLDEQAKPVRLLAPNPEDTASSRFNDGRVDPQGRFIAGTLDESKKIGNAGLYSFSGNQITKIDDGLMTSNGCAFSPDGKTLYHSDTPRFVVYARDYDPATGATANKRVFVQLSPQGSDRGRPDGAAVDVDGCYWTSLYEGGRVQRYDPAGKLMAEYPVPAKKPTMPAFGGADLKTLFVTSAIDPQDPHGGQLFAMPVEIPGLKADLFR
jgi:sugar lactone lactonase YvrE